MTSGPVQSISGFITKTNKTVYPGNFVHPRTILRIYLEVLTAFDGSGTDQIRIGHSTDNDAFGTLTDVSTTGIKTVTAGAGIGYDATPRQVIFEYVAGGGDPSNGSAVITLEFLLLPPQIT